MKCRVVLVVEVLLLVDGELLCKNEYQTLCLFDVLIVTLVNQLLNWLKNT